LYIFTIKIKKLRQNNLIEIDAKFAEMIEKNKKEQEETKKEYKEEVKKELEKVLNRDNKNIEDLNKKIEKLETTINEIQAIKVINNKTHEDMSKSNDNSSKLQSGSYSSVACKNEGEWKVNIPKNKSKQNKNHRKIQFGKKEDSGLNVVDKKLYVHVGNLTKDNTEEDVKNYIEGFLEDELISIELLKSKTERKEYYRKSFKFVTWFKHHDAVYNMENWPAGSFVKRFNMNDKNKENGGNLKSKIINADGKTNNNNINQVKCSTEEIIKNSSHQLENVTLNTSQMELVTDNSETTSGSNKGENI
jgi:hypothetical protein